MSLALRRAKRLARYNIWQVFRDLCKIRKYYYSLSERFKTGYLPRPDLFAFDLVWKNQGGKLNTMWSKFSRPKAFLSLLDKSYFHRIRFVIADLVCSLNGKPDGTEVASGFKPTELLNGFASRIET
jgi:hypothetical protein